jgi:hypothetical protein
LVAAEPLLSATPVSFTDTPGLALIFAAAASITAAPSAEMLVDPAAKYTMSVASGGNVTGGRGGRDRRWSRRRRRDGDGRARSVVDDRGRGRLGRGASLESRSDSTTAPAASNISSATIHAARAPGASVGNAPVAGMSDTIAAGGVSRQVVHSR